MEMSTQLWSDPVAYLRDMQPVDPVLFLAPERLQAQARRFLDGFPGLVTYAVKANPDESVIVNLAAAGISAFDVASPAEIALIRRLVPGAKLHYNNPVRAPYEIDAAVAADVASYSVDSDSELDKLLARVPTTRPGGAVELSPRFKLPVAGAAYDFGAKFGATEELAARLLRRVADAGYVPALTFHPGTQCTDPNAWVSYIHAAARIAQAAGVQIARLNVGGGFPSHRNRLAPPELEPIFREINRAVHEAFGDTAPTLICEPGRSMVADSYALLTRVKAVRDDTHVFLNDGVYGALAELPLMGVIDRVQVYAPDGTPRRATPRPRVVFGPTCDSVDRLPGELALPGDLQDGDFVIFQGLGAYSTVTNTRFNGFGGLTQEMVLDLGA